MLVENDYRDCWIIDSEKYNVDLQSYLLTPPQVHWNPSGIIFHYQRVLRGLIIVVWVLGHA